MCHFVPGTSIIGVLSLEPALVVFSVPGTNICIDTIGHTIFLNKLEWHGVRGKALDWYKSYIHNRKQYVQCNNAEYDTLTVPCGVPQGSVLGPLLFIIYTKDLPNSLLSCKSIIFANDKTIFYSSSNLQLLYGHTNHDLENLTEWFWANKLSLNVDKTHYLIFTRNKIHIPENLHIKIGQNILTQKDHVTFLGLHIDSQLTRINILNI